MVELGAVFRWKDCFHETWQDASFRSGVQLCGSRRRWRETIEVLEEALGIMQYRHVAGLGGRKYQLVLTNTDATALNRWEARNLCFLRNERNNGSARIFLHLFSIISIACSSPSPSKLVPDQLYWAEHTDGEDEAEPV